MYAVNVFCKCGIVAVGLRHPLKNGKTAEKGCRFAQNRIKRQGFRTPYPRTVKRRRCEQDAKGAAFPTGVYIDVHEQGKT